MTLLNLLIGNKKYFGSRVFGIFYIKVILFAKIALFSGARVAVQQVGYPPCMQPIQVQSLALHMNLLNPPRVIPECRDHCRSGVRPEHCLVWPLNLKKNKQTNKQSTIAYFLFNLHSLSCFIELIMTLCNIDTHFNQIY